MNNNVENPSHYDGNGVDCKTALRSVIGSEGMIDYWWGCAFKYLWRWKNKNGVEDLHKCIQCILYLMDEKDGTDDL